jgi:hypothetical protein
MVKQTYRWVVGLGVLLVLIGVGVFVQVKSAHDTRLLHQDLLVGEAVNQLEGCATCHEVTNRPSLALPDLERAVPHTFIVLPESRPQSKGGTPVEARLADAGQRILALSAANPTLQVAAAASDFLRIYEQHRTSSSPTVDQLTALDFLEYWLANLEHQAQTTRWNTHAAEQTQTALAAWVTTGPVTSGFTAALTLCLITLVILLGQVSLVQDHAASRRLDDVIFGLHRRGPPAGAHLDSVF